MAVTLLALAAALLCATAIALPGPMPGQPHPRHRHWIHHRQIGDGELVRLTIALTIRNADQLRHFVDQVSDPTSPNYAQYMSLEELTLLIAPENEKIESVRSFLIDTMGAIRADVILSRDYIVTDVPAAAINKVLGMTMHAWRHRGSGRIVYRAHEAANTYRSRLPSHISEAITLISGLHDFFDSPQERRAIKQLVAAEAIKSGDCPASSLPIVGRPKGSSRDATVSVTIMCKGGNATQNATNPCADFPPAVSFITLNLHPINYAPHSITAKPSDLDCMDSGAGTVMCVFPTQLIPPYSRLNVSANVTFEDGSNTGLSWFPTLHSPSPFILPATIFEMYGVPRGTRATNPGNSQAVTAFELQYISLDDIRSFFHYVGMPYQMPIIVGDNNETNPGGESTLDVSYIMSVGPGIKTYFWSVTGSGPAKAPGEGAYILEWAVQISNTTSPPLVTSISYGDSEDGYYNKFNGSFIYIQKCEIEFQKMAARGLTVIGGSGDAGASNVGEAGNDISDTDPSCTPFRPFYPSNSPYVTSVSATFLTTNAFPVCNGGRLSKDIAVDCETPGEVAVSVTDGIYWTTGGGFSNMSSNPTASWQKDMVASYLNNMNQSNLLPPSAYWNSNGRAYPDIATIGHNLLMQFGGQLQTVDGTSASGPVLGGLVGLLNDARLNAGMPSMGLLNPFLYYAKAAMPSSFNDVVVGSNKDGDIQPRCSPFPTFCDAGFVTAPGWNPVTGLGTPNFEVLKDLSLVTFAQHQRNKP